MKSRAAWKKGAILLQTLVMSIILSLIAIMIMKWVLIRYTMVGRMHRSITANTRGEGYVFSSFPCATTLWNTGGGATNCRTATTKWETSGISGSSIYLDTPQKYFQLNVSGSVSGTAVQTVNMVTEQDQ